MLDELEKKLNKQKDSYVEGWVSKDGPKTYTIVKKDKGKEYKKHIYVRSKNDAKRIATFIGEKGEVQMMYSFGDADNARQIYDEVVAAIQKELPEGWTMESKLDEESGMFNIKFKGMDKEEGSKEFLKRAAEIIKNAVKK